ncbi:RHS repeat protein [Facilibium subflavum]|uniref:RHS repeat protein n=1 Tax=Facilibium subflavum TaxID=2219058 RepID=UPI0013C30BF5|nr:RHS repeat protein [Facilibium subflavum]
MFKYKLLSNFIGLSAYLFASLYQPLYAEGVKQTVVSSSKVQAKQSKSSDELSASKLNSLLNAASSASTSNSFQSQATSGTIPASISVDPATLGLNFSEQIASVRSAVLSNLVLGLKVTNEDTGSYNALVSNLYLNLPTIRLMENNDSSKYYNLYIDGQRHSFELTSAGEIKNYYTKVEDFGLSASDGLMKYVNSDGTVYLFKKIDNVNYVIAAMIDNRGNKLSFTYGSDNSIKIYNDAGDLMVDIERSDGMVNISYKNLSGEDQIFVILDNGNSVSLVNALYQAITVNYQSGNISQIVMPNGASYDVNYKRLEQLHYYVTDIGSVSPSYKTSYVSSVSKHFSNSHMPDQTLTYGTKDGDSTNFAGNGAWCPKAVYEGLNVLDDWLISCVIGGNLGQNYSYATTFQIGDFKQTTSFNALHLMLSAETSFKGKVFGARYSSYNLTTNSVKGESGYGGLVASYANPIISTNSVYNIYGSDQSAAKEESTYYEYFNQSDADEAGFALGQLKKMTSAFGDTEALEYYSSSSSNNYFAPIVKSKTDTVYGGRISTKTDYKDLQWLNRSVSIDGKSYEVSLPSLQTTQAYVNGWNSAKTTAKMDKDGSSLQYGLPMSGTSYFATGEDAEANTAYTAKQLEVSKDGEDYVVKQSSKALIDDTQGSAPTSAEGEIQYFNPYGALIKKVNPVTGDIVEYEYDALDRVSKVTYLPHGDAAYKQEYKFEYSLDSASGDVGYVLTKTVVTPTTGSQGYQTKTYYDQEGHMTKTEVQTRDRSGFYVTKEIFYNEYGQPKKEVAYYYDPKGDRHSEETSYIYSDISGALIGKRFADGSAEISVDDEYHSEKLSYVLQPTGDVITNKDSLCRVVDADGSSSPSSCKVALVSVEKKDYSAGETLATGQKVYQPTTTESYSVIMHAMDYTDKTGTKKSLYDDAQKASLERLNAKLATGEMYDIAGLRQFVEGIASDCLSSSGECKAGSFVVSKVNALGEVTEVKDLVNQLMTRNYYDAKRPTRVIASTSYSIKDNGDVEAIKTTGYGYDQYGNVNKITLWQGAYDNSSSKRIVLGERQFSAFGFMLNASVLVGDTTHRMQMSYDTVSGLPVSITDLMGNKVVIHYDDSVWKSKPGSIDYYNSEGQKEYTLKNSYDKNGNLIESSKVEQNVVVSKTQYAYDPVSLSLISTTVTHQDGAPRTLLVNQNNYGTVASTEYQKSGQKVYQESYDTNALGQMTKISYTGKVNSSEAFEYNADGSLSKSYADNHLLNTFVYDVLGRLSQVKDYGTSDGTNALRTYSYKYNRLGDKSEITSTTEASVTPTIQRFGYTKPFDQLESFSCSGASCPKNGQGEEVETADYRYVKDNLFNQLSSVTYKLKDSGATKTMAYHYDNTDPTQLSSIQYSDGGKASFKYDANGNVTDMQEVGKSGKLDSYQFSYDANQKVAGITKNGVKRNYRYDERGYQIGEHRYNANGKLERIDQYYMGGALLEQDDADGNARFPIANGSIAELQDGSDEFEANFSDGFNVVGRITHSNGLSEVKGNDIYSPFGIVTNLAEDDDSGLNVLGNSFGYRGYQADRSDPDLQFIGGGYTRVFDKRSGVFLQHDSYTPWTLYNGYNYANNNPVNSVDLDGHISRPDAAPQVTVQNSANTYLTEWTSLTILAVGLLLLAFNPFTSVVASSLFDLFMTVAVDFGIQIGTQAANHEKITFTTRFWVQLGIDAGLSVVV